MKCRKCRILPACLLTRPSLLPRMEIRGSGQPSPKLFPLGVGFTGSRSKPSMTAQPGGEGEDRISLAVQVSASKFTYFQYEETRFPTSTPSFVTKLVGNTVQKIASSLKYTLFKGVLENGSFADDWPDFRHHYSPGLTDLLGKYPGKQRQYLLGSHGKGPAGLGPLP
jgi:hypothetical protein